MFPLVCLQKRISGDRKGGGNCRKFILIKNDQSFCDLGFAYPSVTELPNRHIPWWSSHVNGLKDAWSFCLYLRGCPGKELQCSPGKSQGIVTKWLLTDQYIMVEITYWLPIICCFLKHCLCKMPPQDPVESNFWYGLITSFQYFMIFWDFSRLLILTRNLSNFYNRSLEIWPDNAYKTRYMLLHPFISLIPQTADTF